MRTYVTLAALAMTVVAGGGTAAPRVAPVALGAGFDPPEVARRTVVAAPAHDHATHDHGPDETVAAAPIPVEPPPFRATPRVVDSGRFRTPEAAMRYLARAYNRHDDAALRHVTNPGAREQMIQMRPYAPDLRLVRCTDTGMGSYSCSFTHAMPPSMKTTHRGTAEVTVSPAAKPGWYMSGLVDCGD